MWPRRLRLAVCICCRAAGASAGTIRATGQWHANPDRQEISGGYTRDFKSRFAGDAVLLLTLTLDDQ